MKGKRKFLKFLSHKAIYSEASREIVLNPILALEDFVY